MFMSPIPERTTPRGVSRLTHVVPETGLEAGPAKTSQDWVAVMRSIAADDIPAVIFPDAEVRVLSGRYHGLLGPLGARPLVCEVLLKPEAEVELPARPGQAGLVHALEGAVAVGRSLVNPGQTGILGDDGDAVAVTAGADPVRVLVVTDL